MSIPFRCGSTLNATSGLCMYGGICREDVAVGDFYCECPPGYMHDFTLGHFKNCAMPEFAWAIMTGVVAALTVLALVIVLPAYLDLKSQVKQILLVSMTMTVLNLVLMLCNWAQGGAYEAFHIFCFFFSMAILHVLLDTMIMFTTPVYAVVQSNVRRFKTSLRIAEVVNAVLQLGAIVAMIIFGRESNPARYNLAVTVFMLFFSLNQIVFGFLVLHRTYKLKARVLGMIGSLDKEANTTIISKLRNVQHRLALLLKNQVFVTGTFFALAVFPTTILILGSFPGQYILLFFLHLGVPVLSATGGVLFKMQNGETLNTDDLPSSSRPGSKAPQHGLVPFTADADKTFPTVVISSTS